MEVRFKHIFQVQLVMTQILEIDIHISHGIDNNRFLLRGDHIRKLRQTRRWDLVDLEGRTLYVRFKRLEIRIYIHYFFSLFQH